MCSGIGPRQELVDAAIRMAVDDLADHIDQVGVRIDAVEFAGLDQRSNDRPVFAAAVGTGEERVLPVQCDWADATFDDIGIDLDATVIDEAGETSPARQRIAGCLGELALLTDQSELGAQPRLKVINDRSAPVLAHSPALVGAAATDFLFDCIETGDALEGFAGDRRGTHRGELVEAAANVGPAEGELDVTALSENPVARSSRSRRATRPRSRRPIQPSKPAAPPS